MQEFRGKTYSAARDLSRDSKKGGKLKGSRVQ